MVLTLAICLRVSSGPIKRNDNMQGVIPLQPYIREGEGYGSAYVLPIDPNRSAIDPLISAFERRKQDRKASQKELQDELVKLSTIKGDMLPEHLNQFMTKQKEVIDWFGEQRKSGKKVYDIGDPAYLEGKKKMAELAALAQVGKVAKEYVVKQQQAYNAGKDKYEQDSLTGLIKKVSNTPLDNINYGEFPTLEESVNPIAELASFGRIAKPSIVNKYRNVRQARTESGHPIRGSYIQDVVPEVTNLQDLESQYISMMKPRLRTKYLDEFAQFRIDHPDQAKEIDAQIKSTNASAVPGTKAYEEEILRYQVSPAIKNLFKTETSQERIGENLSGLDKANFNAPGSAKLNGFVATTTVVPESRDDLIAERVAANKKADPNLSDEQALQRAEFSARPGGVPLRDPLTIVTTNVNRETSATDEDVKVTSADGDEVVGKVVDVKIGYDNFKQAVEDKSTMTVIENKRGKRVVREVPLTIDNYRAWINRNNGLDLDKMIRLNTGDRFGIPDFLITASGKSQGDTGKAAGSNKSTSVVVNKNAGKGKKKNTRGI